MYHNKDKHPLETVLNIKNILLSNGILTTERWQQNLNNIFFVSVNVVGSGITVNGKGVTKELTLASAYGELMERMQNFAYFRYHSNIYGNDTDNFDKSSELFIEYNERSISDSIKNLVRKMNIDESTINYEEIIKYIKTNNNKVRCHIFESHTDKITVPVSLVDVLYGTNGMAAGNSKYEALVQGLSEIIERYVNKTILTENIETPEIDLTKNIFHKRYMDYKIEIEKNGKYRVVVKDLSLGKRFPAVGLILYNMEDGKYFVKIGVHPVLEIAIERCFTELMQGRSLDQLKSIMNKVCFKNSLSFLTHNIISSFRDGTGVYPLSLFTSSYVEIDNGHKNVFTSNYEMYVFLCKIINDLGYDIFIRDTSYTNIFSYHIIVPGMSEFVSIKSKTLFKNLNDDKIFNDLLFRIKNINNDEAYWIIDYIDKRNISGSRKLISLCKKNHLKKSSVYHKVSINLFKTLLYIKLGNNNLAYKHIEHEISNNKLSQKYYKCFEQYLYLKSQNVNDNRARSILSNVFSELIIEQVIIDYKRDPFEHFPNLDCYNQCKKCNYIEECTYASEKKLYKKLLRIFKISKY